ncbi:hypothetical protein T09_8797 [Trichinella sp. T9]|nr:hypothetical protein T09_8797 [Trichinella sp. T9]
MSKFHWKNILALHFAIYHIPLHTIYPFLATVFIDLIAKSQLHPLYKFACIMWSIGGVEGIKSVLIGK